MRASPNPDAGCVRNTPGDARLARTDEVAQDLAQACAVHEDALWQGVVHDDVVCKPLGGRQGQKGVGRPDHRGPDIDRLVERHADVVATCAGAQATVSTPKATPGLLPSSSSPRKAVRARRV